MTSLSDDYAINSVNSALFNQDQYSCSGHRSVMSSSQHHRPGPGAGTPARTRTRDRLPCGVQQQPRQPQRLLRRGSRVGAAGGRAGAGHGAAGARGGESVPGGERQPGHPDSPCPQALVIFDVRTDIIPAAHRNFFDLKVFMDRHRRRPSLGQMKI